MVKMNFLQERYLEKPLDRPGRGVQQDESPRKLLLPFTTDIEEQVSFIFRGKKGQRIPTH